MPASWGSRLATKASRPKAFVSRGLKSCLPTIDLDRGDRGRLSITRLMLAWPLFADERRQRHGGRSRQCRIIVSAHH